MHEILFELWLKQFEMIDLLNISYLNWNSKTHVGLNTVPVHAGLHEI